MAITSLIVKIGAKDEEIQKALGSIGERAKSVDDTLKKLGNTPVGLATRQSLDQMDKAMKAVTDSYQKLADRSLNAVRGIEQMGGVSKLMSADLDAMGRTVTKGIDAFRALGQEAPSELTKVSAAIAGQQSALKATSASWENFVKGFNIQDAISNPMGTAKAATLAMSESMGGLALAATAGVAAIVAIGGAAFKLATNAAAVGSSLDDMADKTGMSVPALSRLQNAAAVAGTNLGTLTDAVFKVEQRMGEGGAKWDEALKKMGLSTDALKEAGPDLLLETLAAGLAKIQDPAERAAVGVALMGKGAKDVIPVLADLSQALALTNDITPWTAQQAKDAETFEMQISSLVVHVEAFGTAIGRWLIGPIGTFVDLAVSTGKAIAFLDDKLVGVARTVRAVGEAWEFGAAAIRKFRGEAEKLPPITGDAAKGLAKWNTSVSAMAANVPDLNDALREEEFASKALARDYAELTKVQSASTAAHKAEADAVRKAAAEQKAFTDSVKNLTSSAIGAVKGFGAFGQLMPDLSVQNAKAQESFHTLSSSINEFHGGLTVAGDEMASVTIPTFEKLPNVVGKSTKAIEDVREATRTLGQTFSNIPNTLIKAFEGGGGLSGALKSIAVQIGTDFAKTLNDTIKKSVAAGGSAFNAVTVKAAAATGAVAGLGVAMSGASGKASATTAALTGVSVAAGAIGTGATIGGAIALGAATAGIGLAAVGAYFAIKKMLKDPEKQVNPIREQFVQLHGGLMALNAQAQVAGVSLTAMLNAKTPEAYNRAINDLNAALDSQAADIADLDAAIQRYGFSIEELGPAMQRQMLDEQAKQLLNDWRLLIGSGIELTTVNAKMAGSMNDFLKTARMTGTEVPASMKPILQSMIEQGVLLDENGVAVTDLGSLGVAFSETMTQGFDRIVTKLSELLDKIGLVPAAINKIPTATNIDVNLNAHWNIPDMPRDNFAASGGLVMAHSIQHFAAGGNVLPFRRRGSDSVPAMLTPGEIILNEAQQKHVAGAMSGGGGNGAIVAALNTNNANIVRLVSTLANTQARMTRDEVQKVARR